MQTVTNTTNLPETPQNPILTEAYENLVDFVMNETDIIDAAHGSRFGISDWYKAYLSSDEFAALDKKDKQKSFQLHEDLLFSLRFISDYIQGIEEKEEKILGEKKFR